MVVVVFEPHCLACEDTIQINGSCHRFTQKIPEFFCASLLIRPFGCLCVFAVCSTVDSLIHYGLCWHCSVLVIGISFVRSSLAPWCSLKVSTHCCSQNVFLLIDEGRILFCSHFLADLIFKLVSLTMATTGFCRSCLSCFVLCCSNKLHHVHICFSAMLFGGIFCNPEWIRGWWLWILASIVQNSLLLDPSTGPWTAHWGIWWHQMAATCRMDSSALDSMPYRSGYPCWRPSDSFISDHSWLLIELWG